MTEQLEEALSRVFDHAAARAPVPSGDLLNRVESGHSKRRKVRLAVSTGGIAAGCAAVLSVVLVVQNFSGTAKPVTAEPATSSPLRDINLPSKAVPIEKLWPMAVHRISNKLPDNRKIHPQTLADDRTLLITVESSFEKASELLALDLKTKATRKITNVITPAKATTFASDFTVGDGQVIWYTMVKKVSQIWTAPLSGGPAVKIAEASGSPAFLAAAEGKAYWSLTNVGGVLQVPLTGGKATPVPGTAHEQILSWPWVASPGQKFGNGQVPEQVIYEKVRNLRTGETRTAKIPKTGIWACGLTFCYSFDQSGSGPGLRAQLRDGTGSRTAPIEGFLESAPSFDRFIIGTSSAGVVLYDFKTGKIGSAPLVNTSASSPREPYNRLYPALAKGGYLIVDLAAIP